MGTTRNRKRARNAQNHDEGSPHELFGVLHVCCFSAGMKHEDTMSLLARLATSSKQLRDLVKCMVQQHIGQLLPPVAAAAHTTQKAVQTGIMRGQQLMPHCTAQAAEYERTLEQARWLCSLAGKQALQQQAAAVLGVRRVPSQVAVIVQQAGLQLTTENLEGAARARVEGLENWLVAPYCSKLDPLVLAVLTGKVEELKKLLQVAGKQQPCTSKQQPSMLDLMHLATNQQRPAAATTLFGFLQQQHTQLRSMKQQLEQQSAKQQLPQQQPRRMATRNKARSERQQQDLSQRAQQLLQVFDQAAQGSELEQLLATAVARGHIDVAVHLCSLPAASQLPGDAILQLLHRSVVHKSPVSMMTACLLQLAAAADAAAAAEDAMMAEAAAWDEGDDDVAAPSCRDQQQQQQLEQEPRQQLLSGPAAQQQLLQLLEAAVSRSNASAVRQLAAQQALQALDASTCSSLVRTAVELRDSATLDTLSRMSGSQALPVHDIEQLLAAAAQSHSTFIMTQLASLPKAAAITPASIAAMLKTALQAGDSLVAQVLVDLPVAQNISVDDAAQLAETTLTTYAGSLLLRLVCSLPAAAQLAPAALARLLAIALKQDSMASGQAVAQLCALTPAVLGLTAGDVAQLLQAAAEAGSPAGITMICQLPAASQLQADAVYAVLQAAVDTCKPAAHSVIGQLCNELAVASQLQPQQMLNLLDKAMRLISFGAGTGALRALLRLPVAQQLQPNEASALVTLSLQAPRAHDLLSLLLAWLPAAKVMEAAQLAAHVHAALILEKLTDAAALLSLPAASELAHEDVAALLMSLFDQVRTPARMQNASYAFDLLAGRSAAQQMPPQRLVQLLQALLRLLGRIQQLPGTYRPILAWLQKLLALQPAAQIAAADAEQLLMLALQEMQAAVPLLCQLPGAEQLSSAALQHLLSRAIASPPAPITQPAASDSSTSNNSSSQMLAVGRLCKLPGTQQMEPEAYAALLRSALHQGRAEVLKALAHSGFPASTMEKAVLLKLLKTAVQRMTGKGVTYICRLLGPHGLSRSEAAALLDLNEQMGHAFDQSLAGILQALVR